MPAAADVAEGASFTASVVKAAKGPVRITGANSRNRRWDMAADAIVLDTASMAGVIEYEPTELFVKVGAGTPLAEVEALLSGQGQELPGDPPRTRNGTVGGAYACGVSGHRRPAHGCLRDHVLGCRVVDGAGRVLSFGGTLIKNVAGYDVSRLMVGAHGTLGVISEIVLRVRAKPEASVTVVRECAVGEAVRAANAAVARGLPVVASSWWRGELRLLVEGSEHAVGRAVAGLDGDDFANAGQRWGELRDCRHKMAPADGAAWLCRVPPLAELPFDDLGLIEWHGARRWFFDDAPAGLRDIVAAAGGSAVLHRQGSKQVGAQAHHEPKEPALAIHRRLKKAFDPKGILNPGALGFL